MTDFQFLSLFNQHSFYYNPRDEYRFLNIILGEKQVKDVVKERMIKAYKLGYDQQYFQSYLAFRDEIKFFSKITNFKVQDGMIVARFQNNFIGKFDPHQIADNPDDFYNLISEYMFVKIKDGKIVEIYPIEPPNNYEIASQLLESAEKENSTWALLLQSFGYDVTKFEPTDVFLYLPRLFPLFQSPITRRRINYIEISNRGTGKTTTFMILQEFFNFRYYTEAPSFANLIYDARNNMLGAVFLSKGLIFDEIQMWRKSTMVKQIDAVNSALSTGIENCVWSRGAGTENKSAVIHNCLPIIYSGNPLSMTLDRFESDNVEDYLMKYEIFSEAILDRIHIIQIAIKKTYDKIINGKVLYPSILRALVDLIQKKINRQSNYVDCDIFSSRRKEQSIDVQLIFKAMDIEITPPNVTNQDICMQLSRIMRYFDLGV